MAMRERDETAARETCWTLSDGSAGMESQCLGLAEALGLMPTAKRVRRRPLQALLPPHWLPARLFLEESAEPERRIAPPWPDVVISCGRTAVGYALAIKRLSEGRSFAVHVQNPHVPVRLFDLIAAPEHDRLSGANVISTRGALHRVNALKLRAGAQRFGATLAHLPRPLIAVLIGGTNRAYRFEPEDARALAQRLLRFAEGHGAGLALTLSRRTGEAATAALKEALAGHPNCWLWEGTGENPYFGLLGLADAVVVTCDSISMVSEACATGRPVYVVELKGRGSRRFDRFLDDFVRAGMARRFADKLEEWRYAPLDEAERVAEEVRRRRRALEPQPASPTARQGGPL
ncbi:MAG TPA: mitochondrial fission ELM1 family protein [Alphaproteobacteria bacterium]|nr:mitochondrial fission ELM1 family protein [Alphaproteobacteria bacterium]